jgi:hypothetical protein
MRETETIILIVIFITTCAFTATQVEGLIAKLWFVYLAGSIMLGAAWFYKKEMEAK